MLNILGNVILPSLISAFGFGAAPLFDRLALKNMDRDYLSVILLQVIFGGIFCFILFFITMRRKLLKLDINLTKHRLGLLFVIISSILTFFLGYMYYFKAMSKTKYTLQGIILIYTLPIFITAILSYFFLNEKLNPTMLLGMTISIFGIYIFFYGSID